MYTLEKLSIPGFDKNFETLEEVKEELLKFICEPCLKYDIEYLYGKDTKTKSFNFDVDNVYHLLQTPCGCEFSLNERKIQ